MKPLLRNFPISVSNAVIGATLNSSIIPDRRSRTMDREANVIDKCCNNRTITAGAKNSVGVNTMFDSEVVLALKGFTRTEEPTDWNVES